MRNLGKAISRSVCVCVCDLGGAGEDASRS